MTDYVDVHSLTDGQMIDFPVEQIVEISFGNQREEDRDPEERENLKQSIKAQGVLQNVAIRPNHNGNNTAELIFGYGRIEISQELGLKTIPAKVSFVDDIQALRMMLDENNQRQEMGIVGQAKAAQLAVSFANGDYQEASKQLGWSDKKVRSRIQLMKCTSKVLEALSKRLIKIGHAEILNQFPEAIQDVTLEDILKNNWPVRLLKEKAGKAQKELSTACFNTEDCRDCPHNSSIQAQLFDEHTGTEKCSNQTCWQEKTQTFLDTRKQELEEQYGKVLFYFEKTDKQRKTVSEKTVGMHQYRSGCVGCHNKIVVLDDRASYEGQEIHDQCIDLACFEQCKKNLNPSSTPPEEKQKKTETPKPIVVRTKAKVKKALSKPVVAAHQNEIQRSLSEFYKNDERFQKAVTLLALSREANQSSNELEFEPHRQADALALLITKDSQWLDAQIKQSIEAWSLLGESSTFEKGHLGPMLAIGKSDPEAANFVVHSWKPTEENLKGHTLETLKLICQQSGFEQAMGTLKTPLSKMKKKDLIPYMIKANFDWAHYAPEPVKDLIGVTTTLLAKAS